MPAHLHTFVLDKFPPLTFIQAFTTPKPKCHQRQTEAARPYPNGKLP